ncbi:thrombospondin type 3 repeat-containing protein [Luteolibacter arcticus]|uniref:Thrombospondin type 3 repeat-containing protein n=1 Tax=Luteolibacter arcticus TaxID=1581411 RepID=A0ABT3GBJ6_9BACT|nr:thrombospondin type 3 repeat-containing protein [Luteolibacter arcticus]MCW1921002.1 thrombospondin type 3 repeat-containing protein [Luteolibacter arcticus]
MTRSCLFPLIAGSLLLPASAQTLLFWDNFDSGGPRYDLDPSPLAGRRSGTEAGLMVRSSQKQHLNINNQLYMWANGRVRFQKDTSTWCNWAALSPASPDIASAGGLCVEFDITYAFDTTPANWMGFAIGIAGPSVAEPGERTPHAGTDYGFKIGKDGTHTRFGNGVAIGTPVTGSSGLGRHVKLEYVFSSFADGSPVKVKATVAGTVISNDTFTWNGNAGELYMELENRGGDTYFDNIKMSTAHLIDIVTEDFRTGGAAGSLAASFSRTELAWETGFQDINYTLAAGPGDTDNSKFSINAFGELVTGSYDFKQGPAGTAYTIRVQGTGTDPGSTTQKVFTVIPIKDDDKDLLPDDWELSFAGNTSLANLTGLVSDAGPGAGSGNFDGDAFSDLEEYNTWLSTPGFSPVSLDSDGDTIFDTEEQVPTAPGHVVTNPVLADSDRDGVRDDAEYAGGTIPTQADTDGDGARDGFEIERGSNPLLDSSRPPIPAAFALVQVTDDASSGISTSKTYTHRVSGGAAATVNDVVFDVLTTTSAPANFSWTVNGGKNALQGLGGWVPASGGVTGTGLQSLYGSFVYGSLNSGAIHTYQLSGLTPGQTYQFNLFLRKWDDGTPRPVDLIFTNGTDVQQPFGALLYDRPQTVLNNGSNSNSAYYLSYTYVAQDTTMNVVAQNHPAVLAGGGGPHFYGLTNELVSTTELKIVGVSRAPSGEVTINFQGAGNTLYQVTRSPDLTSPFVPLTIPLSATTDAGGVGQTVIPATEASESKEFYRIQN